MKKTAPVIKSQKSKATQKKKVQEEKVLVQPAVVVETETDVQTAEKEVDRLIQQNAPEAEIAAASSEVVRLKKKEIDGTH